MADVATDPSYKKPSSAYWTESVQFADSDSGERDFHRFCLSYRAWGRPRELSVKLEYWNGRYDMVHEVQIANQITGATRIERLAAHPAFAQLALSCGLDFYLPPSRAVGVGFFVRGQASQLTVPCFEAKSVMLDDPPAGFSRSGWREITLDECELSGFGGGGGCKVTLRWQEMGLSLYGVVAAHGVSYGDDASGWERSLEFGLGYGTMVRHCSVGAKLGWRSHELETEMELEGDTGPSDAQTEYGLTLEGPVLGVQVGF